MPARGVVNHGAPIWIDLGTDDLAAAVTFYTALFGWEHQDFGAEFGHYGQFLHQGAPVAGVGPSQPADQPSEWCVYLATSDVEAAATAVTTHGGTVLVPPDGVPGQGRFLMAADPAGTTLGFWQPDGHDGFARVMEPGAPCWFEIWTADYDATLSFARDALGWDTHDMPGDDMRYATNGPEQDATAGVFDAAAEVGPGGSAWLVYLGTDDVDAAAARVRELGGTVHDEPVNTPFGRQVTVSDPTGGRFRLIAT
ncbi:VOC family protein [Isoptericola jiangsuensis]|uniref:VOC family protein n=1 Tax=Isoptericola jiangsuensis TaxID=548579 RepID=UPI003AAFEF78